jgi:restriction endonuclease S subunit
MITHSIIQKSQLEGALRLDAEYYQLEYLKLNKKLKKFEYKYIKDITDDVIYGTTPEGGQFAESGVPFIRSQNFGNFMVNKEYIKFITDEFNEKNKNSQVQEKDILFTAVGSIGEIGIVPKGFGIANTNQNIARVRIKNKFINPYFAIIFFASKYGRLQQERQVTGNVQPYLNSEQIKSFIIPVLGNQKFFESQFLEAQKQIELSKYFYSQAENLLLEELGLKDFKVADDLFYIVNLSEIKSAHRIDAEYFQPKYEKLISKIKEQNAELLGKLVALVGHSTQPEYIESGDIAVLAQKHMKRRLDIVVEEFDNFTNEDAIKSSDKKYILKTGDVLISSAGEPGLTCIWHEDYRLEVIPGSFVTIVRTQDIINPLYLGVFLNTFAGKLQFEKFSAASVQQYVYPKQIKKLVIPRLPKPTQQKIADLVQKSHQARKKAKELLEQAKQKVEDLIEGK